MNWIDAAIVIIFLFFIVTAFQAGFVREVIGITSIVLGVVLAGLFYDDIADTILSPIENETTAAVIGFLIIFVGVGIAGQLLAMLIHPAMVLMQLGIADQLLGAAFGAAKAFVIIQALLILFVTYPRYDIEKRIDQSEFATVMLDASRPVLRILPDEFTTNLDRFDDREIDPLQ
jgi:membrane protein required for colicin V production